MEVTFWLGFFVKRIIERHPILPKDPDKPDLGPLDRERMRFLGEWGPGGGGMRTGNVNLVTGR